MNFEPYLKRINYSGAIEPNRETLRDLQVAHLRNVPFENLSIHAGEPIILDDEALFKKIVENRRGGFCYEANGLFAAWLRSLGFKVTMLSARVAKGAQPIALEDGPGALRSLEFGPEFDHMCLLVELEERWLADVGFGDSFLEPLRLDSRSDQIQGNDTYRIIEVDDYLVLLHRKNDGPWNTEYRFTLEPHTYADFEAMCRFHQTSPESHFTRGRICSRATENGRITLSDMKLITTLGQERDERLLTSQEEYEQVLKDQFGVVLRPASS
jgi:N-hydroxyarylamine O-acetyltransferase